MNKPTKTEEVLKLARQMGVLRVRDLTSRGIHPEYLRRLCQKGLLTRTGRGLYVAADAEISVHHGLAQAGKRVPHGVVCLLSALQFHELGTQSPFEVWMALDRKAARPRIDYPPLRIVRFSGKALTEGIEEHTIESVRVRVYNPAKTVAGCFKYRNKVGSTSRSRRCGITGSRSNAATTISGVTRRSAAWRMSCGRIWRPRYERAGNAVGRTPEC